MNARRKVTRRTLNTAAAEKHHDATSDLDHEPGNQDLSCREREKSGDCNSFTVHIWSASLSHLTLPHVGQLPEEKFCPHQLVSDVFSCRIRSAEDSMCINAFAKRIGHVHKHRKLSRKNGVTLLSEEIASETTKESACSESRISCKEYSFKAQMDKLNICRCRGNEENIIVVGHHLQDQENFLILDLDVPIELVPNSKAMTATRYMREEKDSIQLPIACLQWLKMKQSSDGTGRSPPSKRIKLSDSHHHKGDEEGAGEYSSSHDSSLAGLPEFTSFKDLCISVLKSHGLIGDICQSSTYSPIDECDGDKSMLCKKCGKSGKALKMLICDLCEEAFHRSCSIPKKEELPVDFWYCKPCSQKNPGLLVDVKSINPEVPSVKSRKYLDNLSSMLEDREPYTTRVRIGIDFQVEVPIWRHLEDKHLPDSPEQPIGVVDPAEHDSLDTYKLPKSTTVGNWLQCRETIHSGNDGEETVCGKWRYAPLNAVQTEDWDCSCALPWDPVHADCAVPQEVATEVVLKQLKILEKLKPRVENKR